MYAAYRRICKRSVIGMRFCKINVFDFDYHSHEFDRDSTDLNKDLQGLDFGNFLRMFMRSEFYWYHFETKG